MRKVEDLLKEAGIVGDALNIAPYSAKGIRIFQSDISEVDKDYAFFRFEYEGKYYVSCLNLKSGSIESTEELVARVALDTDIQYVYTDSNSRFPYEMANDSNTPSSFIYENGTDADIAFRTLMNSIEKFCKKVNKVRKLQKKLIKVLTQIDGVAPVRFICDGMYAYNFGGVTYDTRTDECYVLMDMYTDSLPAHEKKPLKLNNGTPIQYKPVI